MVDLEGRCGGDILKRLQNIKFIDGIEENGIDYDWKKIFAEYKKLNVPETVFNPSGVPMRDISFYFGLSTRSVGKTTNWLLIGMIMHELYGTTIVYVRNTYDEIAPKNTEKLMNVIVSYEDARYIKEITDGRYNHVKYDTRQLFYVLRDDNGKEIDRAPDPFLQMVAVDHHLEYKSTLNVFRGDFFIFDEFIGGYYRPESFESFMDLYSTIGRWRFSNRIIMLANTTRYASQWYREFCIQGYIRNMKIGEKMLLESPGGTPMYLEIVEPRMKETIRKQKSRFFGFPNPALNAIVGLDNPWTLPMSPRIKYEEDDRVITKKIRVMAEEELRLSLVWNKEVGLHVNVYPATTKVRDDEILLTLNSPTSRRDLFALGYGDLFKRIWDLYKKNMFFYSDNESAVLLEDYAQRAREAVRKKS